jgi:SAM-dependent methyltransferase
MQVFFALTLLTSATLMFWIEPMFAKMVLPLLGGTPMVWNTCMVFYQAVLLGGYVYAHVATKSWGTRKQAKIHLLVLCAAAIVVVATSSFLVPVRPGISWGPRGDVSPIPWLLGFMLVSVGFPLFVVSASAPMLQAWFADTGHKSGKDPYFLYAASNLGSMGALIAYPLLIEPNLPLGWQTWCWAGGFGLLMLLTAGCAVLLWRSRGVLAPATVGASASLAGDSPAAVAADPWVSAAATAPAAVEAPRAEEGSLSLEPTLRLRLRWLALAFAPSSLLLGVTTFISTDVASFPLMWVIPLALYLLTFVLVFSRTTTLPYRAAKWAQTRMNHALDESLPKRLAAVLKAVLGWPIELLNPHKLMILAQPLVLVGVVFISFMAAQDKSVLGFLGLGGSPYFEMLLGHLTAFFVIAMVCHGELARSRPKARYLTEFYIWMSVGGVLGGMFNALVAPVLFNSVVEYPLMIAVACMLRPQVGTFRSPVFSRWMDVLLPAALFAVLAGVLTVNHCNHKAHQETKEPPGDEWHKNVGENLPKGHWLRPTNQWLNEVLPLSEANDALVRRFGPEKPTFEDSDLTEAQRREATEQWESQCRKWRLFPEQWNLKARFTLLTLGLIAVFLFQFRPLRFGLGVLVLLAFYANFHDDDERGSTDPVIYQKRSFFGVMRVFEDKRVHRPRDNQDKTDPASRSAVDFLSHTLRHGTTDHGTQRFDAGWRSEPVSYYFRRNELCDVGNSPLADVFEKLIDPRRHREIGVCGLGTGTTAAYARRGQGITYFEIDPAVLDIDTAPRFVIPGTDERVPLFTFLHDAKERGVRVDVKLGDARQTLEREEDAKYDLLVLDAFSSDAIPVHLLTKEAIQLYLKKLKPDGVLMVHISNRHLDLAPVVGNIAKELAREEEPDLAALRCDDHAGGDERWEGKSASDWIALARTHTRLDPLRVMSAGEENGSLWEEIPRYKKTVIWTDDFSNIIDVLDWWKRMKLPHPATQPEGSDDDD